MIPGINFSFIGDLIWKAVSNKTFWIVVLASIIVGYLWSDRREIQHDLIEIEGEYYELLSETRDTVYVERRDTVYREGDTIYQEVPVEVEVEVPADVDTTQILEEYYTSKVYKDTLEVDDRGYVAVTDTIRENQIIARYYTTNVKDRTVTETIMVRSPPAREFYAGFGATTRYSLETQLGMLSPSRNYYGVGLGFIQDPDGSSFNPYVGVHLKWQIW